MEAHHHWYDDTSQAISSYKDSWSKKDARKYKLDLLLRVARRVAAFSPECGQCQIFQQEITRLIQDLGNLSLLPKGARQSYSKTIKNMVKHLQSQHELIAAGHNVGIWIATGTGIGVAIGVGMDNVGGGIPIGIAIGVAIGSALDARAKKEGKVI